ncbi:MAG TPA: B12-binding domain-containing radical SAM protein [Nitrospiraceae bacterium]|nr:B12-binding domain-containing radical SAM protein [Nitrospiraceae bacterium]
MKILLLEHPRSIIPERCNDIANTPLSSCLLTGYAAGMLKREGHDVSIVEGYLDGLSYEEIQDRVRAIKPDILGVHMVYQWRRDLALFDCLEGVKSEALASSITAYGFFATNASKDILKSCCAVDSVIIGEPEVPFANLAEAASTGIYTPCVPGLAVRDGSGGIKYQRQKPIEHLDSLPLPVRTEAMYRLPEANLLGSRGCYGKCTFCSINSFYGLGSRWRGRSPENIVEEIDEIISERGLREFYFTDPNFFGPGQKGQERALRIAALLKPRDIRFGIEGRVNDIHDKTIGALVDAGLRHILVGLESGQDESLRRMNKMTTVAQNERALHILRKHGVEPNVGFIMFEPDSSLQEIRINFEFLKRNDLLNNLPVTTNVLYHHQIVLEGTQAYHNLQKEGRLQLQTASSYEGTAYFKNPEVAVLADIMRQITNIVFSFMEGIWSGKVIGHVGMLERYIKVNCMLVKVFEDTLTALEAGEQFDEKKITFLVREAEKEMGETLKL